MVTLFATKMDKDIISLFDGLSTSLGATTTELTVAYLFQAAATLRANKVTGRIYGVFHPYQTYALKASLTNTMVNPNGGDLQNEACVQVTWQLLLALTSLSQLT